MSSSNLPIIVHVGLPKAASTSLQHIFARTTSHLWLGKDTRRQYACSRLNELNRYIFPLVPNVELDGPSIAKELEHYFERAEREAKSGLLMSEEILSGAGFVHYSRPALDLCQVALNLKSCFGSRLRLVVVVREQRAYFRSYYMQLVKQGASFDYETFVSLELDAENMRLKAMLDYSSVLSFLAEHEIEHSFFLFEDLVGRKDGLTDFLSSLDLRSTCTSLPKMNRSAPTLFRMLRTANRYLPRELGTRELLVSSDNPEGWLELSPGLEERLVGLFPEFNRDLGSYFGEDKLRGFGYLV